MTPALRKPADHPDALAALRDLQTFLTDYVALSDPQYTLALSLWVIATYLWPDFDAFPYLSITSDTKRSGKTRLAELLSFTCSNPRMLTGATAATVFRLIEDESPTLFFDEAESQSSEAADTMREVMNSGYRRGQFVPRVSNNAVKEWPCYCPKVFILIGDVRDTLRDRSIVVRMKRSSVAKRFVYELARGEGNLIGGRIKELADTFKSAIMSNYYNHAPLEFIQDREEEIWMPFFAITETLLPSKVLDLTQCAVDMATEKTVPIRKYVSLRDAEQNAEAEEYRERLLRDMITVMGSHKSIPTATVVDALRALPAGPWRKFRGEGITHKTLSLLLDVFGIHPRVLRMRPSDKKTKGKRGHEPGDTKRGYRREDVEAALHRMGES